MERTSMKLVQAAEGQAAGGNLAWVKKLAKEHNLSASDYGLLAVLADMLDENAQGGNLYAIVGTTRRRDAHSFVIKGGPGDASAYALSLAELNTQALGLTDSL